MDAVQQLIVLVVAGVATVAIVLALLFLARRERRLVGGRTSQALTAERVRAAATAHASDVQRHAPEPSPPSPDADRPDPGLQPLPPAARGVPAGSPAAASPARPTPLVPGLGARLVRTAAAVGRVAFHRVRRLVARRRLSFGRRPGA